MMANFNSAVDPHPDQSAQIKRQFSAACHSYDSASRLQCITGKKLFEDNAKLFTGQVLDLGCGTGINTRLIATGDGQVTGCDLAFDMARKTRLTTQGRIGCIQADAEQLPFQNQSFSLVYSNLMLQWVDDLTVPLFEIGRILKPGGQLLFTTLLDGTLAELKAAWAGIDNDNHVNRFEKLEVLKKALNDCGFEFDIELAPIVLDYQNVTELARELKYLGANYVKNRAQKGLMGRQKWSQLALNYQPYRRANGLLPATYQVAYISARLKAKN